MHRTVPSALMLLVLAGGPLPAEEAVDYLRDVRPVLERHCYDCHGPEEQEGGLRLDIRARVQRGGDAYGPAVIPGNAAESPLLQFVSDPDADLVMPPEGERLSTDELAVLTRWIEEGARWPEGGDPVDESDGRDHWAFQPRTDPSPPGVRNGDWPRSDLDYFILARLEREGLTPAREADRVTWLRRVYFDLIGLPPSPEQIDAFQADDRDDAFERVVDNLLDSPRYGERWAQHWLDVVRYADTHGFEVNTERPYAWPYRDYVIDAFNNDTPYDQFVREQIVGDALGKDAATGFLVTASVLLPGQIGKDEPSKRLARQDSLDEIVVNIGQTFLGLSIGCARCHHHKFDPISQRDYYAMQAFVAGVEYGDRELRSAESDARRQEAERLRREIAAIDERLTQFVPLAWVGSDAIRKTSAKLNSERFEPILAKYVRFTIHDANLHPSLGQIEPCLDEFEIYTASDPSLDGEATAEPVNVALASFGTKVTASGSRTSDRHKLQHINDGRYGNARSWMSDEPGRGWVLFELPEPLRIDRVDWSRDREGKFQDRLATSYTLEAGETLESMVRLVDVPPPRPPVNARRNVDRFEPIESQRVRFTVLATNSLEPCLDELEVFATDGRNVAVATNGADVRSSGDTGFNGKHGVRLINDGRIGNASSWISSEVSGGWVEVEFSRTERIDRVIWGRDRSGELTDRLATGYRIEVADASGRWQIVAESVDRIPYSENAGTQQTFSLAGLPVDEAAIATELQGKRQQLQQRLDAASKPPQVFAGTFREPDEIHVLRRGDPEQPLDLVAPTVLTALDSLTLSVETPEQERRAALADWIASSENPLTARVMVNRIWQGHFGTGLVDTANDFGQNGSRPTHPELLDWLASRFVESGWSFKAMHRLIVLSATYRQSADFNPAAAEQDADARHLWRFPRRRLEGEAIRDAMLAVSGRLDLKMGGRGYNLFDKRGGLTGFQPVESFEGEGLRRMIYAHRVRRERDAVFGAFDCPDAGQSTPRRRESTTPIQALNLFNSLFTLEQSTAMADRVRREAGDEVDSQIAQAYRLTLGRKPSASEVADARPVVRGYGLATLCRTLFNCNEFLFLP